MKTFFLEANVKFEAENIDDAFKVLGKYFISRYRKGLDAPDLFELGDIVIYQDQSEVGDEDEART